MSSQYPVGQLHATEIENMKHQWGVTGATEVMGRRGILLLCDLLVGDEVLTRNFGFQKVLSLKARLHAFSAGSHELFRASAADAGPGFGYVFKDQFVALRAQEADESDLIVNKAGEIRHERVEVVEDHAPQALLYTLSLVKPDFVWSTFGHFACRERNAELHDLAALGG